MQREATIEENIWIRKKEKVKRRGEMNRRMEQGQPEKKKLRLEEGLKTSEEKRQTENEPSIVTHPSEKRKVEEKPAKRIRRNYDITCKKWREEEKEIRSEERETPPLAKTTRAEQDYQQVEGGDQPDGVRDQH